MMFVREKGRARERGAPKIENLYVAGNVVAACHKYMNVHALLMSTLDGSLALNVYSQLSLDFLSLMSVKL